MRFQPMDNSSGLACTLIQPTVRYPLYHVVGATHMSFGILAILIILNLFRHISRLVLHVNTKIILSCYLVCCLCYAVIVIFQHISQFYYTLTMIEDCDIFLDLYVTLWVYRGILYFIFALVFSSGLIWVELTFSSIFCQTYESWNHGLGVALAVISCLIPGMLVGYTIRGIDEMTPTIDYAATQGSGSFTTTVMYCSMLIHNLIGLLATILIYMFNTKMQTSSRFHLSSRFQVHTNLVSLGIVYRILAVSISLNIFYAAGQLFTRFVLQSLWGPVDPLYLTLRRLTLTTPIQAFLCPMVVLLYVRKQKDKRMENVRRLTTESISQYDTYLKKQWT